MPPNQLAKVTALTPGTDWIRFRSAKGRGWISDRRDEVIRRSMPTMLWGESKATRTASSMPNRAKAAATESSVSSVRTFLRRSAANSRGRYFTL